MTNAQGQATVIYTASTSSSAPNGVRIQAQVLGTAITSSTTLTVGGQTVFLSLGTGNIVIEYSSTQYELPYSVLGGGCCRARLERRHHHLLRAVDHLPDGRHDDLRESLLGAAATYSAFELCGNARSTSSTA